MSSSSSSSSAAGVPQSAAASPPSALPTDEALEVLLGPDGYYRYLGVAKPEPDAMGPKYQAAAMAAGAGGTGSGGGQGSGIDLDQVKKNYRRLSLRHHPDRKTGDAEAFRVLNRAKVVLSSAKLRREYDLVGLDLEDDAEEENQNDAGGGAARSSENGEGDDGGGDAPSEDAKDGGGSSKTETVMGHLASATLAAVLQVVVRTGLMGLVSVVVSRYTLLVRRFRRARGRLVRVRRPRANPRRDRLARRRFRRARPRSLTLNLPTANSHLRFPDVPGDRPARLPHV